MKLIYGILITLAAGCSATPARHVSSSQWKNKLNCDDGLRIDADAYDNWQIVLFGDAAKHFADSGAFSRQDFNPEGEYVRRMQPDRDVFLSTLQNGQLAMATDFHHDGSSYQVRWLPYGNSAAHGTDYWFKNCR